MNSLTPFVTHSMELLPGPGAAPEAVGSLCSPPLGQPPRAAQDERIGTMPAVPPQEPGMPPVGTPHPAPDCTPQAGIPYTDGTAVPCRQKNADCFLDGQTPGVMAHYMPENNRVEGLGSVPPRLARPTQEDDETVARLVEWREEAPYG